MMSVKALSLVVLNVIYAWILRMIRYLPSVVTCIAGLASISGFTYRASLLKIHINGNHNVPVCNAEVSQRTLVPLYGRGQATEPSEEEVPSNGMVIPQRPPSLRAGSRTLIATTDSHPSQQLQTHQSNSTIYVALPMFRVGGTTTNVLHPMIGEATYARVSGNLSPMLYTYPNSYHLAGSSSLRMRRQQLHADDKSVRRVYIFLFCCVVICLILL